MSRPTRVLAPWTNKFGQTINPGDECIAVTVCTSRVKVSKVEYVGYVERRVYNWKSRDYNTAKFIQIRRPTRQFIGAFFEGTDEKAVWPWGDRKVEYRYNDDATIITTLQHNNIIAASSSTDQLMKAI